MFEEAIPHRHESEDLEEHADAAFGALVRLVELGSLAADVTVTATPTQSVIPDTSPASIEGYMRGLIQFAQGVVPGCARVIANIGDQRNALLMLIVEADLDARRVTPPAARLYLLDEHGRIKNQ